MRFLVLACSLLLCTAAHAQTAHRVGDSGATLEIVSVRPQLPGNEYARPESGHKFIAIEAVIRNTNRNEEINYHAWFFKVKSPDGVEYEAKIMDVAEPGLGSGDLDAQDLVRGWVTFEIPATASFGDLRLRYETWTDKTGWINLGEVAAELRGGG